MTKENIEALLDSYGDCIINYHPEAYKARTVQGRKPGMVWVDDDVERVDADW